MTVQIHGLLLAREMGYPVIIKAALGGGGKGMRVAYSEEEFDAKLSDGTEGKPDGISAMIPCILNILWSIRDISNFRFWQICYGNVVHLGERDCSIQRNHQKLIEESPSAALTSKLAKEDGRGGSAGGKGRRLCQCGNH